MLARTLPLKHLLSGMAIASGVAVLLCAGTDLKFVPMAVGAVSGAAYCAKSTEEDRRTWLQRKTDELEDERVAQIERLDAEFQLQISVWETEKKEILDAVGARETVMQLRQDELAQAREADYELLKQQQEQLRADYDRRQQATDEERQRLLEELAGQRRIDEEYLQRERDQINQERDQHSKTINDRWAEISAAREADFKRLHEQQEALQADFDRRYQQLDEERQRLVGEIETERQNNDRYLQERLAQIETERAQFEAIVTETDQQLATRQQQDLEALEQQRRQIEEQLIQAREALETEFREREQQLLEALNSELVDRDGMIAYLQEQVRGAKMKLPSGKHGYPGYIARQVIECLAKYEVPVGFRDAFLRGTQELVVILEPLDANPVKVRQVRDRLEEIQMLVGFGYPELDIDDEVMQLTFPLVEEKLPVSVRDKAKKPIEIVEPVGDYLKRLVKNNDRLHAWINGDSGGGKSTLVDNYISLIKRELETPDDPVDIIIIDAKDPDTPWKIDGKTIVPQYGGINDPDDPDGEESEDWIENDCMAGLRAMRADAYQRLRDARSARDRGEPAPPRRRTIYVVDEAEEIFSVYGRESAKATLATARLGRSSGIAVVVLGQSYNPQAYGFQIPNLNNFFRIYLRESARKGVQTWMATIAERNPLLEQIAAREARSKTLSELHPHRFWGFIKCSGEPGFLAQLPAPHSYSKVTAGEVEREVDRPPQSTNPPSSTLDMIKQAKAEDPNVQRLNELFHASGDKAAVERSLEEPLRLILLVARKKKSWIGVSELKAGRSFFKNKPYEAIAQMFFQLANLGLGEYAEENWNGKTAPQYLKEGKPRFRVL